MSGRKRTYVSVPDDELRALRESQARLATVRRDMPKVVDGVRAQVRTEFNERLSSVDERQRRFESQISGLSDQVRSVETNAQRRLEQRDEQLRAGFERDLSAVRSDFASQVDSALAEERTARERDMSALTEKVDKYNASVQEERAAAEAVAREWLEGAQTLRAFIDTELAHERFAPGRLAALTSQLAGVETNANAGMWQAAVVGAQDVHRELSDLRTTVELLERDHVSLHAHAHQQLLIARSRADANATLPLSSGTTATDSDVGFVDFWTDGQNAVLVAEIAELLRKVEADELDSDELRALLNDDVPRLMDQIDTLVGLATHAEISSQLRANIAERVVDVLAHNGFDVTITGGYEQGDQRREFLAQADHEDGSRVVASVRPTDDGRAELSIHSFDEDTGDEETRLHRAYALREQLQADGLELGAFEPEGGPDPAVRDVPSRVQPPRTTTRSEG